MTNGINKYDDADQGYIAKIDSYLDGQLSDAEMKDFKRALENNAALRKEFELRKEVYESLADHTYDNIRDTMSEILDRQTDQVEMQEKGRVISFNTVRWRAMAAALILLIGLFAAMRWFTPSGPDGNREALAEYMTPYSSYSEFRSEGDDQGAIDAAFFFYENEDYEAAEKAFASLEGGDSPIQTDLFDFYRANSLFALDRYESAETIFARLVESDNRLFTEQSRYYRALCLIGMDGVEDRQKAQILLGQIIAEDGAYAQNARDIVAILKK